MTAQAIIFGLLVVFAVIGFKAGKATAKEQAEAIMRERNAIPLTEEELAFVLNRRSAAAMAGISEVLGDDATDRLMKLHLPVNENPDKLDH